MTNEFTLIQHYLQPLASNTGAYRLQNDAAVFSTPEGFDTVVTCDALTENVHFLPNTPSSLLAKKLLRVNLSDMAAMGGIPRYYLIAAVLPDSTGDDWWKDFCQSLQEEQTMFSVSLLGGDTVSHTGPLSLSLTLLGEAPQGEALRRDTAQVGDTIYVSGTIGDAALGLQLLQNTLSANPEDAAFLTDRYHLPQPRLALGQALAHTVTCAMDISDGLVGDLQHICTASGIGATVYADRIPLSGAVSSLLQQNASLLETILTGGDDYELLFTAPPGMESAIAALSQKTNTPITAIGTIEAAPGVRASDAEGNPLTLQRTGFRHFE